MPFINYLLFLSYTLSFVLAKVFSHYNLYHCSLALFSCVDTTTIAALDKWPKIDQVKLSDEDCATKIEQRKTNIEVGAGNGVERPVGATCNNTEIKSLKIHIKPVLGWV